MLDFLKNQAASFFVCFLLKCFENDVAEQELFDVASLRDVLDTQQMRLWVFFLCHAYLVHCVLTGIQCHTYQENKIRNTKCRRRK